MVFVDRYLVAAAECQRQAENAKTEMEKASWLRLAESWMRLVSWKGQREREEAMGMPVLGDIEQLYPSTH